MATFTIGTDIVTSDSFVTVDATLDTPLPKGQHTFQLVVVDDDGLQSDPVTVDIVVRDDRKPTAVLAAPVTVPFGQTFRIDGSKSSDLPPGKVVKFVWTMLR
jgi:hypothetical protein